MSDHFQTLHFVAKGLPKGQPRARAFARKFGATYSARMYDPQTADEWKADVMTGLQYGLQANGFQKTEEPVSVAIVFVMPRPKSHSGKHGLKESSPRFHVSKPDVDNLIKLVFDVITRSEKVWNDDSQVAALMAEKKWAASNEEPGCIVTISTSREDLLVLPTYGLQSAVN